MVFTYFCIYLHLQKNNPKHYQLVMLSNTYTIPTGPVVVCGLTVSGPAVPQYVCIAGIQR